MGHNGLGLRNVAFNHVSSFSAMLIRLCFLAFVVRSFRDMLFKAVLENRQGVKLDLFIEELKTKGTKTLWNWYVVTNKDDGMRILHYYGQEDSEIDAREEVLYKSELVGKETHGQVSLF